MQPMVANVHFQPWSGVSLAPGQLYQPILPGWQFSGLTVNLGSSSNPANEQAALDAVGSYGKQIGHLAEALEVLIEKLGLLDSPKLTEDQRDALKVVLGDVAQLRGIKAKLG